MNELKWTYTRHVALQLISTRRVKSALVNLKMNTRKYVLSGGVLGGPEARAVRELVNASLAREQMAVSIMTSRPVKLTEAGRAYLSEWNEKHGEGSS